MFKVGESFFAGGDLGKMTKPKPKSKKAERSKDSASNSVDAKSISDGSNLVSGTTNITSNPSPSTPTTCLVPKASTKLWFQSEIQAMMYAFGDCRKPSAESATLIEEIVHQQITSLLIRAADVTALRGGRFMSVEDIIFLMRRDKEKLKRLIRYLSLKELKNKAQKLTSQEDNDQLDAVALEMKMACKKRKVVQEYLGSIDHTGDLINLLDDDDIDEVKQERLERAEKLTRTMDTAQYIEYSECRQANFNKKAGKFKEWLDCASLIDVKPNTPVMEIFSYLAYETVGQIVELALLVKNDCEGNDLMSSALPTLFTSSRSSSSSSSNPSSTPTHTPPSTPTTPTGSVGPPFQSGTASASAGSLFSSSTSISNVKTSKSKKRKAKSSSSLLFDSASECIQPHHIREAIRRYNHFTGPMAPFSCHIRPTAGYRTLCS